MPTSYCAVVGINPNAERLNLQDGFIDLTEVDMTNLESEVVEDLNEVRRIHSPFERHLSLDEFTKLMMSVPVGIFMRSLICFKLVLDIFLACY